jgi:hypothetical protein
MACQVSGVRRTLDTDATANLEMLGVDVLRFDGLDHGGGESSHDVVEAVVEWLSRNRAQ